jgi:hypothetical protein
MADPWRTNLMPTGDGGFYLTCTNGCVERLSEGTAQLEQVGSEPTKGDSPLLRVPEGGATSSPGGLR